MLSIIGFREMAIETIIKTLRSHPNSDIEKVCRAAGIPFADLTKSEIERIQREV